MKESSSDQEAVTEARWREIHGRLDAFRVMLEKGWAPLPEERKAILKARAKALAREPGARDAPEENLEVVEFLLAHERYAIESAYVREVWPLQELTRVPCTPPFVLGIINVRGRMVSVLDLKKFFDLPEKGLTDLNRVIIIENKSMEFGILADGILGARSLALADIQAPPPTLTGIRAEYLRGITRESLVILAADRILSDRDIVVQE